MTDNLAPSARVLAVATGRFGVEELKRHQPDWTVATLEEVRVAEVMGNGTLKRGAEGRSEGHGASCREAFGECRGLPRQ